MKHFYQCIFKNTNLCHEAQTPVFRLQLLLNAIIAFYMQAVVGAFPSEWISFHLTIVCCGICWSQSLLSTGNGRVTHYQSHWHSHPQPSFSSRRTSCESFPFEWCKEVPWEKPTLAQPEHADLAWELNPQPLLLWSDCAAAQCLCSYH